MSIKNIKITNLRNIQEASVELAKTSNAFYGVNGSGKTSLLESIALLSLRKSFRTSQTTKVVSKEQRACSIFSVLNSEDTIGISKTKNGPLQVKLNGENGPSAASIAHLLPLQLINTEGFKLLDAGPKLRREFMDWGLFHVEQEFYPVWKKYHDALKNRNSILKSGQDMQMLDVWNGMLVDYGKQLDARRQDYVKALYPVFQNTLENMLEIEVNLEYLPGWPANTDLLSALERSLKGDLALGHTQFGPHRAEIAITSHHVPVDHILSRGQQKIVMCALKLAQGQHLLEATGKTCLYLVDDVAAELDKNNIKKFAECLQRMAAQVFVTGIEREHLANFILDDESSLFHVEQGVFTLEK